MLLLLLLMLISSTGTGYRYRQYLRPRQERRTSFLYNYLDLGKVYTSTYENTPWWPKTVDEMASDAAFCVKIALMSDISRVRVDVRLRLTNSERSMMEWIIHLCKDLLETEVKESRLRVFMEDGATVQLASTTLCRLFEKDPKMLKLLKKRVKFNVISQVDDFSPHDSLFIVVNPNNIMSSNPASSLLEDVQAICFHGALRNIPTIMTNPSLIATAWNDYGAKSPLLLSDFAQAYFICDDLFMMSSHDQFIGLVQRPNSGVDLFLLHGLYRGICAPKKYERIESFPDGMPDSLRSSLAHHLATKDPHFPLYDVMNAENKEQYEKN